MSQRVFIASSFKAIKVAEKVQALLREKGLADVHVWNGGTFELNKTYIESLENEVNQADFGVLVLAQDDELLAGENRQAVPRDNVVFELGLFIGRLGRERSFYIQAEGLRLPTDLLAIESPKFLVSGDGDLRAALEPACSKVAAAILKGIRDLPSLPHLTDEQRAAQKERRRLYDHIAGAWWERIKLDGKVQAVSFFTITADEGYNSVRLDGDAYGKDDGALKAKWRCSSARMEDRKIVYVRECQHLSLGKTNWLPGPGVIEFSPPATSSGRIVKGFGKFWEGDETKPELTIIKTVDLRRVSTEEHRSVMEEGLERDMSDLVKRILGDESPIF